MFAFELQSCAVFCSLSLVIGLSNPISFPGMGNKGGWEANIRKAGTERSRPGGCVMKFRCNRLSCVTKFLLMTLSGRDFPSLPLAMQDYRDCSLH